MSKEYVEFYGRSDTLTKLEKTICKICPKCEGKGSHVNPSVDGHGISQQEFQEDPEFERDYFTGVYDVDCYECGGKRVIKVVDWSTIDADTKKQYDQYLKDEADYQAECAMERRMGA